MTDEKMAEESLISYRKEPKWAGKMFMQDENICYKDGFLAGLRAGRQKWHDLRKNPNDLPEDTYDVLDQAGYKIHYNFFQNVWVNEKDEIDEHVIAWCEIPKYTEE